MRAHGFVLPWVACTLVGAVIKLPEAIQTPGSDSGMFATYGRMLLDGRRPYVDFWDVHPPLVYLYWALVELVTGPDWLHTCITVGGLVPQPCLWVGVHGLDLLLAVAAALAVAGIARELGAGLGTTTVAALLVVGFANQAMLSQEGSNPSKLTLLPSTFAVWSYLRARRAQRPGVWLIVAGAAAGSAILAKQPAVATLLVLLGHAAWQRQPRAIVYLLVGASVLLLAACAWLASLGALGGFVEQAWLYNIQRASIGYWQQPAKTPTITLTRMLREAAGPLVASATLGAAVLILAKGRLGQGPVAPGVATDRLGQGLVLWWAAPAVIGAVVLREFVAAVPPLAVLGALGLAWAGHRVQHLQTNWRLAASAVFVVLCLGSLTVGTSFQQVQMARAWYERGPRGGPSVPETVGLTLRNDAPAGPIFVYPNAAHMYLLAGRQPASRWLNAEALRKSAPDAERSRRTLVSELRQTPPPVVVLGPHLDDPELLLAEYPQLASFLSECYAERPPGRDLADSSRDWKILLRTDRCQSSA